MTRFRTLALASIPAAAALALPPAALLAQDASPLTQVQAHLRAVGTMTAGFSQTDKRGRTLTGTMTLKRPGRVRFEYQRGTPFLIVADGKRLAMIDYETRRVESWPIGNSPLGVLLDANPDLSRIAKVTRNDAQTLLVSARDPKRPEFGTITVGFAKVAGAPSGLMLQGWTMLDSQNNVTTVKLSGQRFNVPVADTAFRWTDPRKRGPKG
ncbi:MAG: outer membrane lipoprotein carrier protein LolA [Alphaproteobacteria bacterium]|nr:outer membrane lipoprotein carrier protein LolA [Alphaproteobacteria bacterium]MBV9372245.1 outer membrane lipoprotein carrier protein LolA [Alphaproteobacteria bacterium]MBV9901644.1 outer membrane lipoprotein carrier protein LolA [Alphaproteobacteria bacterium]